MCTLVATVMCTICSIYHAHRGLEAVLCPDCPCCAVAPRAALHCRSFEERLLTGQRAKQIMIQSNHRLVMSVCKKYIGRGMAMQDLVTVGMQGLMKGIERFDHSKVWGEGGGGRGGG